MNTKLQTLAFYLLVLSVPAFSQNTLRLFDSVVITPSDATVPWRYMYAVPYRTAEVYLNCPVGGPAHAYLTGPSGGNLIVDNFMTVNGANVCPEEWNCFAGLLTSPATATGLPVQTAYIGVSPLHISGYINGSGVYRFELMDYGWSYGSTEIFLNTSCTFEATTQVCHRNFGRFEGKTLTIGESALAAHLAHGDTEGPCSSGR